MTLVVLSASWLLAAFLFSWHNMGWNILNFMRSYMHYLYLLYLWRNTGQGFFRYSCCRIPIKCVFLFFLFSVCSMICFNLYKLVKMGFLMTDLWSEVYVWLLDWWASWLTFFLVESCLNWTNLIGVSCAEFGALI